MYLITNITSRCLLGSDSSAKANHTIIHVFQNSLSDLSDGESLPFHRADWRGEEHLPQSVRQLQHHVPARLDMRKFHF